MTDLLPPNSSPLERALARACASIDSIPVPLRDLWNPDKCPAAFLPFLASAFSVDRWDASWSTTTKRAVIKAAFFVHKRKGTIGALRRVVEPLGYLIRVIEWWQTVPEGEPGTFRLDIGVLETGINEETHQELERLIDDAKPVSRHLLGLAINLEARGSTRTAVSAYFGDELTVYPYTPAEIFTAGLYGTAGIAHTVDTMTVQPLTTA